MEAEPTLEEEAPDAVRPAPAPVTVEKCLAYIAMGAMPSEHCADVMPAYAEEHPEVCDEFPDWCRRQGTFGRRLIRTRPKSGTPRLSASATSEHRPLSLPGWWAVLDLNQ